MAFFELSINGVSYSSSNPPLWVIVIAVKNSNAGFTA